MLSAPGITLAVIPAREGSKRVLAKNIRPLLGKPLIEYTIEAALTSRIFDRVVVSTDSETIGALARAAGADVPFIREADLADDTTHVSAVTLDALERLDPDGTGFGHVAQLLPNCPLRTADDVRESYEHFLACGAAVQISVARYAWQNPWWAMRRAASGELVPLHPAEVTRRSQDLAKLVCPTGAVWWAQAALLRRERTFHVPGRVAWEMAWARAMDIDTEDDLELAELLLQRTVISGVGHEP